MNICQTDTHRLHALNLWKKFEGYRCRKENYIKSRRKFPIIYCQLMEHTVLFCHGRHLSHILLEFGTIFGFDTEWIIMVLVLMYFKILWWCVQEIIPVFTSQRHNQLKAWSLTWTRKSLERTIVTWLCIIYVLKMASSGWLDNRFLFKMKTHPEIETSKVSPINIQANWPHMIYENRMSGIKEQSINFQTQALFDLIYF